MREIVFSVQPDEVSCLVGNLFAELDPPCDVRRATGGLTICGRTPAGNEARLLIFPDCCVFAGEPEDLEAAKNGKCPVRRCYRA